jgi:outer membrane receptor protein involved in Fe transport
MLPTLGSMALAQTSTPAAPPPAADESPIVLNAFTVSTEQDSGYRAANSIAGTRTNTPIKDIPLNIQVFTKDLAEDLLIRNQVDFEAYNASLVNGGADPFTDNVIQQAYQQFLFRGFVQNWGLRDGIREYDPVDTQNLARVEVVKGPAAALYGLAYPGGVMNNISKQVDFSKNFTSLRFTAGLEGDYRATIDTNVSGTLAGNQKVGIRVNGTEEKSKDVREHSEGFVKLKAVEVSWQPTPSTLVQFLGEQASRGRPNGLGYFAKGDGTDITVADPTPTDPDHTKVLTNHSSVPLQITHPEIPWTWNWANGDNLDTLDTNLYRGTITQKVGENFQVQAYFQYSDRIEKPGNGWDVNGSGGADSGESLGSNWDQATNTITSTYAYRDWGNKMHAYGATAVYKLDFEGIKNTFAFGANVWGEKELSRLSQPLNPLASAITYAVAADISTAVPFYPPADLVPVMTGSGYHHEDNSNDYYFANWQMSAFNNRLKTNIGVNKTNMKLLGWDNGSSQTPNTVYEASKVSPLFGAVFDITKEVSVFAVHSTSLFPDSTKDSFGKTFSPQVGKSWEGGVKVDLFDGKLSGTVSYYQITQSGGSQNDPNKENKNTQLFDSLSLDEQQKQFGGIRPLGDIIQGGEQEAKGFDVDLQYQPTRAWQVVVSYTHVDHKFTESAVARTIGETNQNAQKDRYSLLTKYTFLDGNAKGLFLGAGLSGGSKQLVDYVSWNGQDVARYTPARLNLELFGGYRFKLAGYDAVLQLNLKNLTQTSQYVGWKSTGSATVLATERYEVSTPVVYRLTLGLDF